MVKKSEVIQMAVIRSTPSRRVLCILLAVLLLPLLALGCAYLADPFGFRMAPGTSVGQVDLSGMHIFQAAGALENALEETLYSRSLTVVLPKETLSLSPRDTNPKVDTRKALWDAYGIGRWSDTAGTELSLSPYLSLDEAALENLFAQYAAAHDTVLTQPVWTLEGEAPALGTDVFDPQTPLQTLSVTLGYPEQHLDPAEACRAVRTVLENAPSACAADAYALTLAVTPTALPEEPDVEAISREISTAAVSDSLSLTDYTFVPGSYGCGFDEEQLKTALASAEPGQTVSVSMEYITPEILGDQVYFRDVLGSYETKHTNNENRNTNLRLLCQALSGHIVQPGEEFSYNTVVGERTAEKGYKPAPAYSGNRLVDSIGGGVCQGSTTLYNCVLLADLEVVFRACHGASVGYVPRGLDAAVNYLTTDFKFRNNWHFPVMLRAEVSDGYVKMQILGTDEKDYYIKMEALSGEDDIAVYSRSYRCKIDKATNELRSRDLEAYSTYYKNIG